MPSKKNQRILARPAPIIATHPRGCQARPGAGA